jgi:hypothetical protein
VDLVEAAADPRESGKTHTMGTRTMPIINQFDTPGYVFPKPWLRRTNRVEVITSAKLFDLGNLNPVLWFGCFSFDAIGGREEFDTPLRPLSSL